jgi:hypothetical protein
MQQHVAMGRIVRAERGCAQQQHEQDPGAGGSDQMAHRPVGTRDHSAQSSFSAAMAPRLGIGSGLLGRRQHALVDSLTMPACT